MGCFHSRPKSNNDINILYVEDVEIYFNFMEFIITKLNSDHVNLIWKTNTSDAYEYIKNEKIDFIFVDRMLVEERGDTLIETILEEKLLNVEHIIIISALNDSTEVEKYRDIGLTYFIKPLNIQKFINRMNKLL